MRYTIKTLIEENNLSSNFNSKTLEKQLSELEWRIEYAERSNRSILTPNKRKELKDLLEVAEFVTKSNYRSNDPNIRWAVASTHLTQNSVLNVLIQDKDSQVAANAARSKKKRNMIY